MKFSRLSCCFSTLHKHQMHSFFTRLPFVLPPFIYFVSFPPSPSSFRSLLFFCFRSLFISECHQKENFLCKHNRAQGKNSKRRECRALHVWMNKCNRERALNGWRECFYSRLKHKQLGAAEKIPNTSFSSDTSANYRTAGVVRGLVLIVLCRHSTSHKLEDNYAIIAPQSGII